MVTIFQGKGGPLDQALPEIFKTQIRPKPRQDSVTYEFLQDMVTKPGYCYTVTFTLDMKKKPVLKLINDPWKQWQFIKDKLMLKINSYKFRCVMVPEQQTNGVIHGHGVVRFIHDNYFDMDIARARLMKHMSKTCGRNLQWTRINSSTESYMPTESNKRVNRPQTLKTWHDYLMKEEYRRTYGILNTENL